MSKEKKFMWQRDKAVALLDKLCDCPFEVFGDAFEFCTFAKPASLNPDSEDECQGYNHCWMKYIKHLSTQSHKTQQPENDHE